MKPRSRVDSGQPLTRRAFLSSAAAAGAAVALVPTASALGLSTTGLASAAPDSNLFIPTDRPLRVAFVGIGNRGNDLLKWFTGTGLVEVVALCDVDLLGKHTEESRMLQSSVALFSDFRRMFERVAKSIDAVVIATPDHSHLPITMHAMRLGKHVYVEKPMAQSFRDVDLLMEMAARSGVVTQMGNQGHSGNNYFQFKAWSEAGVIKDVTKIVAFMNSPRRWHGWTVTGFPDGEPMPERIDWDGWHAARAVHPFSSRLHPETWRGWFHYGTGAFGDWGAHILDTAHQFLQLGLPHTVRALRRDGASDFIYPQASTIRFEFAARGSMPPVDVVWYDGVDNRPPLPAELGPGATLAEQNGKFIYSRSLVFKGGTHGETLRIIPESRMTEMAASLPKIGGGFSDHAVNFVRACQGLESTRSPFSTSGPLTQVLLLGALAQRTGGTLSVDPARRTIAGNPAASEMLAGPPVRKGWEDYYRV